MTTPQYPNLQDHINQSGITYGPQKLALMQKACRLMEVPTDNLTDEGETKSQLLRVKLFDPCGSFTWYVQDWDGEDICFGYVTGIENEWGSFSLQELSDIKGRLGIGIEVDVYFKPIHHEELRGWKEN
jgi:hypothetical protein